MFNFILLIGTFGLVVVAFILILIDLLSYKKYQKKPLNGKFPKLSRNSVIISLVALVLLVFVGLAVAI